MTRGKNRLIQYLSDVGAFLIRVNWASANQDGMCNIGRNSQRSLFLLLRAGVAMVYIPYSVHVQPSFLASVSGFVFQIIDFIL